MNLVFLPLPVLIHETIQGNQVYTRVGIQAIVFHSGQSQKEDCQLLLVWVLQTDMFLSPMLCVMHRKNVAKNLYEISGQ